MTQSLPLSEGNVFLLDDVDGVGGTPALKVVGCVATEPKAAFIERTIAKVPAVRDFLYP